MYAVVNSGGKQYKVQQGQVLRVEKIPGDVGSPVTFDRVLLFSDGETHSIGQPALDDIAVEGHIVEQGKAKKIIVFKYKRRKRYRRKKGHRQAFTAVMIDGITPKVQQSSQRKEEPKAEAKKPATEQEEPTKAEVKKPKTGKDESEAEAKKSKTEKAAPQKAEAKKTAPKKEASKKDETKAVKAKKAESEKETKAVKTKKAESEKETK